MWRVFKSYVSISHERKWKMHEFSEPLSFCLVVVVDFIAGNYVEKQSKN